MTKMVASQQSEPDIQTLTRLGLTFYQVKVYIALERSGTATAKTISKVSGVPREKVYQVLLSLMDMGLVNKLITSPISFKALPINDAAALLLRQKLKDYKNLRTEIACFLRSYELNDLGISPPDDSKLMLIPSKDAIIKFIQTSIKNAEVSIYFVASWKKFSQTPMFANDLSRTQKRDVEVRCVMQKPKDPNLLAEIITAIGVPYSGCRTVDTPPVAEISLYDQKHVLIDTQPGLGIRESPIIVTDNPSFVELAKAYFEKMWTNSQPCEETSK